MCSSAPDGEVGWLEEGLAEQEMSRGRNGIACWVEDFQCGMTMSKGQGRGGRKIGW
jgi:hypothetical protein